MGLTRERWCCARGWLSRLDINTYEAKIKIDILLCLKKNQNTPRPFEHPPVMGGKMSTRLGGIKGSKYKTSLWHLNRFPDADNIGSTV